MEDHAERSIEARDPLLGRILEGRYHLLSVLGRGGMGVVYLADHVRLRRRVAIKMLHPQLTGSQEVIQRFHREARAAAAVGNEHIVDVTDMGHLDDGSYYIVLEYLDGIDLAELVASHGPLQMSRAAGIVAQICGALTEVHAAGIVHRDLKPENIFLIRRDDTSDFVKILDFGICKFHEDRPLTATGIALGTPRFMAPEQLEARPDVDHRADVYAAGAILYFALTGRGPFEADSLPGLLMSVWSDPAPRLREACPTAPEALEQVVSRALEKQPRDRFKTSAELERALRPFMADAASVIAPFPSAADGARQQAFAVESGNRKIEGLSALLPSLRRARRLRRIAGLTVLGCLLAAVYLSAARTDASGAMRNPSARTPATGEERRVRNSAPVPASKSAAQLVGVGEVNPPANLESQQHHADQNDPAPDLVQPGRRSKISAHRPRSAAISQTRTQMQAGPASGAQAPAPIRSQPAVSDPAPPVQAPTPQPEPVQLRDVPLPRELKHVFER